MSAILDQAWAKDAHEKLARVVDTVSLVHGCLGSIKSGADLPECIAELSERALLPLFEDLDGLVKALSVAAGVEEVQS